MHELLFSRVPEARAELAIERGGGRERLFESLGRNGARRSGGRFWPPSDHKQSHWCYRIFPPELSGKVLLQFPPQTSTGDISDVSSSWKKPIP